jgi:hypothetical protein
MLFSKFYQFLKFHRYSVCPRQSFDRLDLELALNCEFVQYTPTKLKSKTTKELLQ